MTIAPDISIAPSMGSKMNRISAGTSSVSFITQQPGLVHTESTGDPNDPGDEHDGHDGQDGGNTSLPMQLLMLDSPTRSQTKQISNSNTSINTSNNFIADNITLVLYEFSDVLLTNAHKYFTSSIEVNDGLARPIDRVSKLDHFGKGDILLTYGGYDRVEQLKFHFEHVLSNNILTDNQANKVLCFLLSDFVTSVSFELLKRGELSQYFVTIEPGDPRLGIRARQLSHVIGSNHLLRKENDKEYLVILKLMHVLRRSHENVLYIGHRKEIIEHLASINACHTHYIKTKGITQHDIDTIKSNYSFGCSNININGPRLIENVQAEAQAEEVGRERQTSKQIRTQTQIQIQSKAKIKARIKEKEKEKEKAGTPQTPLTTTQPQTPQSDQQQQQQQQSQVQSVQTVQSERENKQDKEQKEVK